MDFGIGPSSLKSVTTFFFSFSLSLCVLAFVLVYSCSHCKTWIPVIVLDVVIKEWRSVYTTQRHTLPPTQSPIMRQREHILLFCSLMFLCVFCVQFIPFEAFETRILLVPYTALNEGNVSRRHRSPSTQYVSYRSTHCTHTRPTRTIYSLCEDRKQCRNVNLCVHCIANIASSSPFFLSAHNVHIYRNIIMETC